MPWGSRWSCWSPLRTLIVPKTSPYGDQGQGLAAALFKSVGGFPALPIMDDFELMRRLRARERVVVLPAAIRTSPRRWRNVGVGRTTLINPAIVCAYLIGLPPRQLARFYRRSRGIG